MKNYELVKILAFSNRCIILNINQSNNYSITESIVGEQLNQLFYDQQLKNLNQLVEEYEEEQEKEAEQFKQLELEIEEHLTNQVYEQQAGQMKSQQNDKENDNKIYQSNSKETYQQLQSKQSFQSQQEQYFNSKQSNQVEETLTQQNFKSSNKNNQFDMFSEEDLDEYFKARQDKIVRDQQQSASPYNKVLIKDDEFSYNSPTQQATLYSTPKEFQKSNLTSERSNFNSKQNYFQIIKNQRDEDFIQDVPIQRKTSCFNYTDSQQSQSQSKSQQQQYQQQQQQQYQQQQQQQISHQPQQQNNFSLYRQDRMTSQQQYKSPINDKINKSFDALENMSYLQHKDHKIFTLNTQRPLTPQNKVANIDSVQSKSFAQINYQSEKPQRKRIFEELKPTQISQLYSTNKSPRNIQENNDNEFETLDIKDFYKQMQVEIKNQKYQHYSNFTYLQKKKK